MLERNNPKVLLKRFLEQAPAVLRALPDMPMLVHDFLALQNAALRAAPAPGARPAGALVAIRGRADDVPADARLRRTILGAALTVAAALLGAAHVLGPGGEVPVWVALGGGAGLFVLARSAFGR